MCGIYLHTLEEFHVMIDDLLQVCRAVVVEVRRCLADPMQPRHVQLVPVVLGGQPADKAGQQRRSTTPGPDRSWFDESVCHWPMSSALAPAPTPVSS